MSFEALGLHTSIVKAVSVAGYEKPTPVQEQAVPAGIAGRDMLVSSQTGSGKTAAFMLPALNKFANQEEAPAAAPRRRKPRRQKRVANASVSSRPSRKCWS
jgi:superfamily II DNA/RNA helicase